ncbi:MAG TPA: hypothetical protein PKZ84_22285 [Anaerolineae bacterium]|nr:hypothetical protein [Anaerolineae bacterium]HQI87333.1 hypothetical protein [Anaerolineae bacterium]
MTLEATTLEKLSVLETLYRRGYQSDVIDLTVDKMIALERERAERELKEFDIRLKAFEQHYQMRSEDFYRRFQQGQLGDSADFFEWSAVYAMHQSVVERLENFTGKQL